MTQDLTIVPRDAGSIFMPYFAQPYGRNDTVEGLIQKMVELTGQPKRTKLRFEDYWFESVCHGESGPSGIKTFVGSFEDIAGGHSTQVRQDDDGTEEVVRFGENRHRVRKHLWALFGFDNFMVYLVERAPRHSRTSTFSTILRSLGISLETKAVAMNYRAYREHVRRVREVKLTVDMPAVPAIWSDSSDGKFLSCISELMGESKARHVIKIKPDRGKAARTMDSVIELGGLLLNRPELNPSLRAVVEWDKDFDDLASTLGVTESKLCVNLDIQRSDESRTRDKIITDFWKLSTEWIENSKDRLISTYKQFGRLAATDR